MVVALERPRLTSLNWRHRADFSEIIVVAVIVVAVIFVEIIAVLTWLN
jgi:hypothetical protein